jgi:hypothetical protein
MNNSVNMSKRSMFQDELLNKFSNVPDDKQNIEYIIIKEYFEKRIKEMSE